jgi:hypothetical protein
MRGMTRRHLLRNAMGVSAALALPWGARALGSAHLWVRRPRLAVEPILVRIRLILVG